MAQPSAGAAPSRASGTRAKFALSTACLGALCATLVTTAIPQVESGGKQYLRAYKDIAGVWTICDGDTKGVKKGDVDTVAGCEVRLDRRVAHEFGPAVLKRAPALKGHDWQLAAAIVFAWNVGIKGWNSSTAAKRFAASDFAGGCAALGPYFVDGGKTVPGWIKAGGKVSQGLINRRTKERTLCLTGSLK